MPKKQLIGLEEALGQLFHHFSGWMTLTFRRQRHRESRVHNNDSQMDLKIFGVNFGVYGGKKGVPHAKNTDKAVIFASMNIKGLQFNE